MDIIARDYATLAHSGQIRKLSKEPYACHPTRVGNMIKNLTEDETLAAIGYLHDVLEDTDVTYHTLQDKFGPVVANGVLRLTNDPEQVKLDKTTYLINKMSTLPENLLLIKLADRLDNVMDLKSHLSSDGTGQYDKWIRGYITQTCTILDSLNNDSHLQDPNVKVLINLILQSLQGV